MQKKYFISAIMCTITFILVVFTATYAFFASRVENNDIGTNVAIGSNDIVFISSGSGDLGMNITNADLYASNADVVAKSVSSFIDISLTAGTTENVTCTYDISWNWEETDIVSNRYVITNGATKEYTISGSANGISFNEIQVPNYNPVNLKNSVYHGTITNNSEDTPTIQNWNMIVRFYNLTIEQTSVFEGNYVSTITLENISCIYD